MKRISRSEQETFDLGVGLGKKLKPGDCLALYGELGTGKTTFVKGLAKARRVKEKVLSPSFVFSKVYGDKLAHFDFYRLEKPDLLLEAELADIIAHGKHVVVIEWPERLSGLPARCKKVNFKYLSENEREIEFE